MLQQSGQSVINKAQGATRGWGYVSARVTRLRHGESLALPDDAKRFVLISGSLRMDCNDASEKTVFALAEPADTNLPSNTPRTLHALSDSVLVLYSER